MELEHLKAGMRVEGLAAIGTVTIVAVEPHGPDIANVTFRTDDGALDARLVTAKDAVGIEPAVERRWTFEAPGESFRLASEARRIQQAHLFDPYSAVQGADIDPLPHQIEAVYQRLLPMQPLQFLLADDPGAGKTIMSGLYIAELMLRGDLDRCLIVAPGSLVEQWQEELDEKFGLHFSIMSRDMVEAARTGNPFNEQRLLIARLDQLARSEDLQAKLAVSEWDLVICDEAHKMSAHLYGDEVKRTLRYTLGELLRERARNFLLLTATPHNGSNDDFLLFLSLLDPDRFTGRLRNGEQMPDVNDIMRRYVKENLLTFEGTRLFKPRTAETAQYELTPAEQRLYEQVTDYVQEGMGKAKAMEDGGDKRRGLAVGFALAALQRRLASSPDAIFHSLRRRRERLQAQAGEARKLGQLTAARELGLAVVDPDGIDIDDFNDDEFEQLEDQAIEQANAAATIGELEAEIVEVRALELLADEVRHSEDHAKWIRLREILQSDEFKDEAAARKLIIFTEHKDTLTYLVERIQRLFGRNDIVVAIHGGVKREERKRIQDSFRLQEHVKILVATDAAGEGVNLQRANLMVNYDLPWNPNRIEQRFGRIHRIGQTQPCHLWNMVAHETREGRVFERLLTKIEQQRAVYGDQIYDVLGEPEFNQSLQTLLLRAIAFGDDPKVQAEIDEVVDADYGARLESAVKERQLINPGIPDDRLGIIRSRMQEAQARKLAPGFLDVFFHAALDDLGGRMTQRSQGRYRIARVPAAVRSRDHEVEVGAALQPSYELVTFDKKRVTLPDDPDAASGDRPLRAELITSGHPLMRAVILATLERHGAALTDGTVLIDRTDATDSIRVLVSLEHRITDGRVDRGGRRLPVSSRFQFVEVHPDGDVTDPGADPYLNYDPADDITRDALTHVDTAWIHDGIDQVARSWATAHLATPHFEEIDDLTQHRVAQVRAAVNERLEAEIRYWDSRAAELKAQELQGKNPRLNSGRARQRADDLDARRTRRLRELDLEADLANSAPTVVGAAIVIPQGLLDRLAGREANVVDPDVAAETDRRAVAAVMEAERRIGRIPVEQDHNNPGFDILSDDPETKIKYFIEVKGHRPDTDEIKVRGRQVMQAQQNPETFRLAVVRVPNEPDGECAVGYHIEPFAGYTMMWAQTHVPMSVAALAARAVEPQ